VTIDLVTSTRQRLTGGRDNVLSPVKTRSRAPLRLGLAGGGTDVSPYCDMYGGFVLNATIDHYCYVTVEGRTDGRLVFDAADVQRTADLDTAAAAGLELHAAVYRRLNHDFALGDPALTVTSASDAPPGSGLGSSSTLVVALITAFRHHFALPLDTHGIARLAFEIERVDCGLSGGRQDQYAATFGGFNSMEFYADRAIVTPLHLRPETVRELEASIVLYDTGVSRSSASIIDSQRAHIRKGQRDQLQATHVIRKEAGAMRDALVQGNFDALASVLEAGWSAKKQLADGISTRDIEHIFDVAYHNGARAGKLSGAGGGGYIMFMAEPVLRPRLARCLAELPGGRVEQVHFVREGATAWTVP
jgi:D-glycero-alpha-D-manno-heptose-7-phosphate kinase